MEAIWQDFRQAMRRLAATPGFTIAAILSLGLGIGANTVIFSAVNGVLLSPLPLPNEDRLVFLPREGDIESDVSIPDVQDWREQAGSFERVAGFIPAWDFDLTGVDEPIRLTGQVVEPELFDVLAVEMVLGRRLTTGDNIPGGARVAVISEGLWRRRFNTDPAIVGKRVVLSDHPTEIVGVVPDAFDVAHLGIDLYVPVAVETPWALAERGTNNFEAIGLMGQGVSLAAAREEIRSITEAISREYPRTNGGKIITPTPLSAFLAGSSRAPLVLIQIAVGLVLAVTCVNLTNFLLARATARRQELAVRLALGAGPGRLLRQLLAESLLVALVGGGLGIVIALWGRDILSAVAPSALPRSDAIVIDTRVLGFALALSLLTGVLVGLGPGLGVLRRRPGEAMNGRRGTTDSSRGRRLDLLVSAQVALALLLLITAGLLGRSFLRLQHTSTGFNPDHLLVAGVVLPESRYGALAPQTQAIQRMVSEIKGTPGVIDAAFAIGVPMSPSQIGHTVVMEDRPHAGDDDGVGARVRPVEGDYFGTMEIPLIAGRLLESSDLPHGPPVAVINQTLSREVWPNGDALGKRIAFRGISDTLVWMTVVGIVGDVKSTSMAGQDSRAVYLPYVQRLEGWQRFGTLVVRTGRAPMELARGVNEAVWRVDPTLPLSQVMSMTQAFGRSLARERFAATLLGVFALAAVLIAMQGIYAVLAYGVIARRKEIGVHLALGAPRHQVVSRVVLRGVKAAAIGLVLGLAGAYATSGLVRSMLFEVTATDPMTYVLAVVAVFVMVILSSVLPARRAARVEPVEALRAE